LQTIGHVFNEHRERLVDLCGLLEQVFISDMKFQLLKTFSLSSKEPIDIGILLNLISSVSMFAGPISPTGLRAMSFQKVEIIFFQVEDFHIILKASQLLELAEFRLEIGILDRMIYSCYLRYLGLNVSRKLDAISASVQDILELCESMPQGSQLSVVRNYDFVSDEYLQPLHLPLFSFKRNILISFLNDHPELEAVAYFEFDSSLGINFLFCGELPEHIHSQIFQTIVERYHDFNLLLTLDPILEFDLDPRHIWLIKVHSSAYLYFIIPSAVASTIDSKNFLAFANTIESLFAQND
jgi:hypothetical protein